MGFLAVALWDDPTIVRTAASRMGITMPVAQADGEVLGPNDVRGVPSVLFVDERGVVVDRSSGTKPVEELRRRTRGLLGAQPQVRAGSTPSR